MPSPNKDIFQQAVLLLLLLALSPRASAQNSLLIRSDDNSYGVQITLEAERVITRDSPCPDGYPYKIAVGYTIEFVGQHLPDSLFSIAASIGCGTEALGFRLPKVPATGSSESHIGQSTQSDCRTATPESLNCNTFTIRLSGPGLSETTRTMDTGASSSSLPIELAAFEGSRINRAVLLKWQTAREEDNDYFTIQRSANGRQWADLDQVAGAGNSSRLLHYRFLDHPGPAGAAYYRLQQTNYDGTVQYSEPIIIMPEYGKQNLTIAYPNPSNGQLTVTNGGEVQVYEVSGREVTQQARVVSRQPDLTSLDLSALPAGTYLLQLPDQNLKIIKS